MTRPLAVRATAPATIGNLAVGFDVLGAALEEPHDEVVVRRRRVSGVLMADVRGDGDRLPRDAARNTAGVAVLALLQRSGRSDGVAIELIKGIPLAGGMGSSAASAVAAVVAADRLLETRLGPDQLLACALDAERAACGAAHPDNAAPCLLGGIVLTRPGDPPEPIRLPVPEGLSVALLHPPIELATRVAREAVPAALPLETAVAQWADLGAVVAALFRGDWALLGRALVDRVAEPARAALVPGFRAVQRAALETGALGCSLSGAGPSIFALCRGVESSRAVGEAMAAALAEDAGLAGEVWSGPLARTGARVREVRCAT